jgi:hypothetical protein
MINMCNILIVIILLIVYIVYNDSIYNNIDVNADAAVAVDIVVGIY